MVKKLLISCAAILTAASLTGTQVLAVMPGTNASHSHGSSQTITEDMLFTEDDIPEDYDVNQNTQGNAETGDNETLFDTSTIQDVNIEITSNNWNYLLQNADEKPTVLTTSVTIGGETVSYAGIKTKGNLTLSSVWNSDSDRFSFTVNFGKYIKKKSGYSATQNFYGLSKVAFNNIYGDATLMKEYLSYELMTAMGVATPKYCLVNLSVNGEFWGVYMMVESIDSSLTKRTLGDSSDFLVKPESSGGDLVYDSALDQYLNEDGEFEFDLSDYPDSASSPLYKYNGLWENDPDTFDDVKEMLPTVFQWMKILNELSSTENPNTQEYQETLESILNVDEVLRYFAANTYLVNLDSYQSEKMQNYALFIDDNGYASVLPWDYNYSFGAYGVGSAQEMVNFDISEPVINTTLSQRPLLNALLQNDEYRALYEQYLADCCAVASTGGTTSDGVSYAQGNFAAILARYAETLKTTYAHDPTAFYSVERYEQAIDALTSILTLRSQAVIRQLEGDMEPVSTDINLNTLGDVIGGSGSQPGGNGQPGQQRTLTDTATGISVTGQFPDGASLTVSSVTEGTDYTQTAGLLSGTSLLALYRISVSMPEGGQAPPNEGIAPPDNGDNDRTPPTSLENANGNMPSAGNGDAADGKIPEEPPQGGQAQIMTVTAPLPNSVVQSDVAVYQISADGSAKTLMTASVQKNVLTFTASELGLFAVTETAASEDVNSDSSASDEETGDSVQNESSGSILDPDMYGSTDGSSQQDAKIPQTGGISQLPAILLFLAGTGGLTGSAVLLKMKHRKEHR